MLRAVCCVLFGSSYVCACVNVCVTVCISGGINNQRGRMLCINAQWLQSYSMPDDVHNCRLNLMDRLFVFRAALANASVSSI